MAVGFVLWSMGAFDGQNFAICGKTIASLRRNVIMLMPQLLGGIVEITDKRSDNKLIIRAGEVTNRYYLFGGRDESSYALVQGITLAGVLFDEVALMPRSFVEQAMARCSVENSKLWFNCNPEGPAHWFYVEWIQEANRRNMLHLHFTMNDNPSLSEKKKAEYEGMYSGVFYDRYIRGLWTVAEGLIYTMFNKAYHVVPSVARDYEEYYISCDYGTLNPTSAGLWGLHQGKWYRVREYYYDGRKEQRQRTDEEHYEALEHLAGNLYIRKLIVDPSAASFIEVIRRHDRFMVEQASNRVLDGIRDVATHLNAGDIFICDCCSDCIREFGLYRWDEKAIDDRPLKTDDHCLTGDTIVDTENGPCRIDELIGKQGRVWSYNVDNRTAELKPFYNVRQTSPKEQIYKITLEDGRTFKCTGEHPVLTDRGFVEAKHLKSSDKIVNIMDEIRYNIIG